jgi:hypothetical protein
MQRVDVPESELIPVIGAVRHYISNGDMIIDGYRYIEGEHVVARNKQNKDEYIDISLEYKTVTMHMNTIPEEFKALVDLCKKTKAKQISSEVTQVKNAALSPDNQRGK